MLKIKELASLHDIGKIGIPDKILKKPGPLNEEEWDIMRTHVAIGHKILSDLEFDEKADNIALYHHENWDGSGYLNQLEHENIPLEARIVALADVYDALRSTRCYKKEIAHDAAVKIIKNESGKKFDPYLVTIFLKYQKEFMKISIKLAD